MPNPLAELNKHYLKPQPEEPVEDNLATLLDPSPMKPTSAEQLRAAAIASLRERELPGLWHSLKAIASRKGLKGATYGTGKEILKLLGHQAANIAQAVSPVPTYGATDPVIPLPGSISEVGGNITARLQRLGNAALLGLPDVLAQAVNEALPPETKPFYGEGEGKPATPDELVKAHLFGTLKTAVGDIGPGNEAAMLLTGETPEGKPLTEEEAGMALTAGALKTIPFARAIGGSPVTGGVASKLGQPPRPLPRIRSIGEIGAAAKALRAQIEERVRAREIDTSINAEAANRFGTPEARKAFAEQRAFRQFLPEEVRRRFEREPGTLDLPELQLIENEVVRSEVFNQIVEPLRKLGKPINEIMAESIRRGALSDETLNLLMRSHGLTGAEASEAIARVVMRTATTSAQELKVFSDAVYESRLTALAEKAYHGDKEAVRQIRILQRMKRKSESLLPNSQAAAFFQRLERFSLATMLSQWATAQRNIAVQGKNFIVWQVFDDLVGGTAELITRKAAGESVNLSSAFADVLSDFHNLASRFSLTKKGKTFRHDLDTIIRGVPVGLAMDMMGASTYEIGGQLLSSLAHTAAKKRGPFGKARGFLEEAKRSQVGLDELVANVLTSHIRLQEHWFRRLFFGARLQGNLERAGFKLIKNADGTEVSLWDQVQAELVKPKLREDVRWALADAAEHSVRQTFAARPESAMLGKFLDLYRKVPGMTVAFHPFPRFVMNSWRWLHEHSPGIWFDLFDPSFRQTLMKGAEGGFASRDAARALGRAASGTMLLMGAYALRTSEHAGPKYYQLRVPDWMTKEKGRDKEDFLDARNYEPFDTALLLAEMVRHYKENAPFDEKQPLGLSANDWLEAMFGMRRANELPPFAFLEGLRGLGSDDPGKVWKAFSTVMGQFMGRFFVTGRMLHDIYGAAAHHAGGEEHPEELKFRDTRERELLGPTISNIPGLSRTMPPRIDFLTGQPMESEHPIWRQGIGASIRGMTKLGVLLADTATLDENRLVGRWSTQEADSIMREEVGRFLTTPVGDTGKTRGDILAERLRAANLSPLARKYLIQQAFTDVVRPEAEKAFAKRNPKLYALEKAKKQVPEFLAEPLEEFGPGVLNEAEKAGRLRDLFGGR